jgi:hypothetical protein
MTNAELATQLASLRLPRTAADLEDFVARATKGRWRHGLSGTRR